ncbi:MAG: divalent-cation tolerance protein CutA [Acidobacteriota bacterium]
MSEVSVVFSTVPNPETGAEIARTLVEERLAACVNILAGLRSVYHWRGRVEDDSEALLIIKTTGTRLDRLFERLKELHPYEVPEMLALPVHQGWPDYLDWVRTETKT